MTMDYEVAMRSIWKIEVNGGSMGSMPAVSIAQNRILTWAANNVFTQNNTTLFGQRLHQNGFIHELEIVHFRSNLGLTLLKCKNPEKEGGGEFLNISQDENLDYLEKLSHIGHPQGLPGLGYFGYACYPCIEVDPLSFSQDYRVCNDHRVSMYDQVSAPYRKMGDFVNLDTFSEGGIENNEFNRQLHPMVPVIQCGGMPIERGSFGGPLFRQKNGDIMGIVTHCYGSYCMAVHVSAIKAFVAEASAKSNHERVGANGSEASTSRES